MGSTRLTVDDTGTPIGTREWDAWGNQRTSTGTNYGFGWTGEQYDAGSDLVYLRARYYSPGTANFLSRDTIQPNAGGVTGYNPYTYATGNPTTLTDPSGHFSFGDIANWVGGAISAIFFYMAAVLECFSIGNCRFKGQWGNSAKHELVVGVSSGCGATGITAQVIRPRTLGPSRSIAVANVGLKCPVIGRGPYSPDTPPRYFLPPGLDDGDSGNSTLCGDGSNTPTTDGLNINAVGPEGMYRVGNYIYNGFEFKTLLVSRCVAGITKMGLENGNSGVETLSAILAHVSMFGCKVPQCKIAVFIPRFYLWLLSPDVSERVEGLDAAASDPNSKGAVLYTWRPEKSYWGQIIFTQQAFFSGGSNNNINPCLFAALGDANRGILEPGNSCNSWKQG